MRLSQATELPPHAIQILREAGVLVDTRSPWQPDELIELARTSSELPAEYRSPDRPILLSKDNHSGKSSESAETIGDFNAVARQITLYPYYFNTWIASDDRETYLAALKQAFVHELTHALDEVQGYSKSETWKGLSGWEEVSILNLVSFLPHASNVSSVGFARPYGQTNPAEDLATYAEAFFMPAAYRDPEKSLKCRTPSKYAYFRSLFKSVPDPQADVRCQELSAWIDPERVDSLEILLASPSPISPASIAGHLLLRVRMREMPPGREALQNPEDIVLAFLANPPPKIGGGALIVGGLSGRFVGELEESKLSTTVIRYTQLEDRDLWRYRLKVSRAEIRHVLARLFEVRKNYRYRYQFLSSNCATMLTDQLAVALRQEELRFTASAPATPSGALAVLVQRGIAEEISPSFYSRSRKASIAQREIRKILSRLGAQDSQVPPLLFNHSGSLRAEAYRKLARIALRHPEVAWDIYQVLSFSLPIERSIEFKAHAGGTLAPSEASQSLHQSLFGVRKIAEVRSRLESGNHAPSPEASEAEEELVERRLGSAHTGIRAIAFGADYLISGNGDHYELEMRSSMYSQKIGDPSRFALYRGLGLEILPSTMAFSMDRQSIDRWKSTLLEIQQLPENARSILDRNRLGFGIQLLEMSGDRWRHQKLRSDWVTPQVFVDLVSSRGFRDYLYLSAGLQLSTLWPTQALDGLGPRTWAGVPAAIHGQLSLDRGQNTVLRAEIGYTARFDTLGRLSQETHARASASARMGELLHVDLRLEGAAEYVSSPEESTFYLGIEALPN